MGRRVSGYGPLTGLLCLLMASLLSVSCDDAVFGGGTRYTVDVDGIIVTNSLGGYYCPENVNVSVFELDAAGLVLRENIVYDVSHGRIKTFPAGKDAVSVVLYYSFRGKSARFGLFPLKPSQETVIKVTANDNILKELGMI